jgi:glycosyltransferase involved in cell wall biosynthesis
MPTTNYANITNFAKSIMKKRNKFKVAVIIPCYNESEAIEGVLEELKELCPEYDYIVINDSSSDNTSEIAKKTGLAKVIDLPVNLRIGGAVQTGLKYADLKNYDFALKYDGDGQHRADEIDLILGPLIDDQADIVIGSRFLYDREDGFKSTFYRRLGIKIFELVNSFLIRQKITDNTAGFRAYNKKTIQFLAKYYPSFDYPEPEEVVLLGKNGFKIKEVPVRMRVRQGGVSSINNLKSVYFMVKVLFSVLIVAIRPRIISRNAEVKR